MAYPPNVVSKIALLYDPSWATELPNPLYNLPFEDSARGYLAYLIQQRLTDGAKYRCNELYIIDKEAKWFWTPPHPFERQVLYWDCDAEYVEIEWSQVVPRRKDCDPVGARGFIHKLDALVQRMQKITYMYGPDRPLPWVSDTDPPLKTTIKLLVRRDNQVKEHTMDCESICYKIGWCVCSEQERACKDSAREHDTMSDIHSMLG
ncbi:hypothetical protein NW752_007556 [Fusarium irregulare]|nr:hypothetical protein NW752_007556 [Fusarium irregulare]